MTNLISTKPSRVDFDRMDINQVQRILSTGSLDNLTPQEREYYSLMEMVRGLRARMRANGKVVTKAGIIRLLKSEAYGLSDWQARQVYADAVNFFYDTDDITPRAFSNLYAEKAENLANLCAATGKMADARAYLKLAAELRGCFKQEKEEIPDGISSFSSYATYQALPSQPSTSRILWATMSCTAWRAGFRY